MNKSCYIICILPIILLFYSCNSFFRTLGTYKRIMPGYGTEEIQLDSNGRFVYELKAHMEYYYSKGVWERINQNIYLTSDTNMTSDNRIVNESYVPSQSETRLQFLDQADKLPYVNLPVTFNDSFTLIQTRKV